MAELLTGQCWVSDLENDKVDVPIEHLDFDFISKCTDARKMQAIVDVLKSGKEGSYPELQKCGEERLLALLPEKERLKLNRLNHKTTPLEIAEAEAELERRRKEILSKDAMLRAHSSVKDESTENRTAASINIFDAPATTGSYTAPAPSNKKLPPIRGSAGNGGNSNGGRSIPIANTFPTSAPNKKTDIGNKMDADVEGNQKPKRISGYDFKAWEKFDVDAACAEVEGVDTSSTNAPASLQTAFQSANGNGAQRVDAKATSAEKRAAAHKREMDQLQLEMGANNLTPIQKTTRANREKIKGNECHRIGENEDAFACYSRSLALDPSNAIVYANRAITCIRLERFELAEDDCTRALALDKNYVKAWARRGMARFKRGNYKGAAEDFEEAALREPNNVEFKTMAENAAAKFFEVEGRHLHLKTKSVSVESSKSNLESFKVPVVVVKSIDQLCLPSVSAVTLVHRGTYSVETKPAGSSVSSEFTRIAICEDESGSESENDNDGVKSTLAAPTTAPSVGFTRIAVCEDEEDGDSEEDAEEVQVVKNHQHDSSIPSEWDINLLKQEALKELSVGNFSMAISMLEKGLLSPFFSQTTLPESSDKSSDMKVSLLSLLAAALSAEENHPRTVQVCDEITSIQPNNFKSLQRRAGAHLKMGNKTKAATDCRTILAIDPGNTEAAIMLKEMQPAKIDDDKNGQSVEEKKNASIQLKDKGNEAMTKQAYSEAARLYSESINLDPDNTISYNNRAQALLKLSRFVEAEKDAALVMAKFSSEKSSPHFKKASFRRALALRGMGGEKNLVGAIALLEELSKLDPDNKDVKLELARSSQLQKDALLSAKVSGVVASSSPISPALDMTERASKKRTPTSSQTEDIPLPRPHPVDSASTENLSTFPPAAPAPNSNSKSTGSSRSPNKAESPAVAGASSRLSKEPEVPDTLPATVYELERTWRALKSHPRLFAIYLSRFKTSTFKKVFKEAVSSELLSSMMIALRDHGSPEDIIAVFTGFSNSASFDMTIMMLPAEDTNNVKTIIAKLDGNDPKVQELKAKYKV